MYYSLIKQITEAFHTENYIFYRHSLSDSDILIQVPKENALMNNKVHWDEINNSKEYIIDDIFSWYENNPVFNYLLPSILIYCVKNHFEENEAMLCLMEKLAPSFYNFGDCRYFDVLFTLTSKQRNSLLTFLYYCEKINPSYSETYRSSENAIDWLDQKDALIKFIYQSFNIENIPKDNEIITYITSDTQVLKEKLSGINWIQLLKNESLFSDFIIENYIHLAPYAFCYYMPVCLIMSLNNLYNDYSDVAFHTLNRLCHVPKHINKQMAISDQIDKKYLDFSSSQRIAIRKFLELVLKLGKTSRSLENQEMIRNALANFWSIDSMNIKQ